jgi:hypothetical protein
MITRRLQSSEGYLPVSHLLGMDMLGRRILAAGFFDDLMIVDLYTVDRNTDSLDPSKEKEAAL